MGEPVRVIDEHHDGLGLNDTIELLADELGPGGASHHYVARINGQVVADVQFQRGPRNEEGSTPGVTEAALLCILLDRLRAFQAGPYPCRENALVITHLDEALLWVERRAKARAKRGVLGKNQV